jgi:hypothetical protein
VVTVYGTRESTGARRRGRPHSRAPSTTPDQTNNATGMVRRRVSPCNDEQDCDTGDDDSGWYILQQTNSRVKLGDAIAIRAVTAQKRFWVTLPHKYSWFRRDATKQSPWKRIRANLPIDEHGAMFVARLNIPATLFGAAEYRCEIYDSYKQKLGFATSAIDVALPDVTLVCTEQSYCEGEAVVATCSCPALPASVGRPRVTWKCTATGPLSAPHNNSGNGGGSSGGGDDGNGGGSGDGDWDDAEVEVEDFVVEESWQDGVYVGTVSFTAPALSRGCTVQCELALPSQGALVQSSASIAARPPAPAPAPGPEPQPQPEPAPPTLLHTILSMAESAVPGLGALSRALPAMGEGWVKLGDRPACCVRSTGEGSLLTLLVRTGGGTRASRSFCSGTRSTSRATWRWWCRKGGRRGRAAGRRRGRRR